MFRQPEAPAPTAMAKSEIAPMAGETWPCDTLIPTSAVKITRTITRGFSRAK